MENIGISIRTNNINTVTTFPPIQKPEQSILNNIKEAVFRSMNFTSKFCNLCEISGKTFNDNGLYLQYIKGAQCINNHHCAGNIQYHKDYERYLDDIDIYFEIHQKYFQTHNLCNMKLKFERSNGDIEEGIIAQNSGIYYITSRNALGLYLTFNNGNEKVFKWIPFLDTESKSLGKTTKGLLSLNPELLDKELIITFKKCPEWLEDERDPFIENMKVHLDNTKMRYKFNIV